MNEPYTMPDTVPLTDREKAALVMAYDECGVDYALVLGLIETGSSFQAVLPAAKDALDIAN